MRRSPAWPRRPTSRRGAKVLKIRRSNASRRFSVEPRPRLNRCGNPPGRQSRRDGITIPFGITESMQDFRLAFRALRATPIVTVVAALSLTLGIGANTAIFSLVNGLLLRPLPGKEPGRLVMLSTGHDRNDSQFSYALFEQVRHLEQFDGAVAWNAGGTLTLGDGADTQPVVDQFVSGEYFSMLGVGAVIGRTLTPADDAPGGGAHGL